MTPLLKPVKRLVALDGGRCPVVVELNPAGFISFRPKSARVAFTYSLMAIFAMAVRASAPPKAKRRRR